MNIGFIERGEGLVEVGPFNHNLTDEIWLPRYQGRLFRQDPATFTLVPVEVEHRPSRGAAKEIAERVFRQIDGITSTGETVRRSGKYGMFERKERELSGISRAKILAAIADLIDEGKVVDTDEGLLVVNGDEMGMPGNS